MSEAPHEGRCRSCGAAVTWRQTASGKWAPYDADGTTHFATCPQGRAWQHRTPKAPSVPDENSEAAAEHVEGRAAAKRARVLTLLQDAGPLAEWEIEQRLGWGGNTVRPRLWELEKVGLVEKHGKVKAPSGRDTWRYRVVPPKPKAQPASSDSSSPRWRCAKAGHPFPGGSRPLPTTLVPEVAGPTPCWPCNDMKAMWRMVR